MTKRKFTAVYKKDRQHYLAWVEEVPGVNTQGLTKNEARGNLREALLMVLEANRKILKKQLPQTISRESFEIAVPA